MLENSISWANPSLILHLQVVLLLQSHQSLSNSSALSSAPFLRSQIRLRWAKSSSIRASASRRSGWWMIPASGGPRRSGSEEGTPLGCPALEWNGTTSLSSLHRASPLMGSARSTLGDDCDLGMKGPSWCLQNQFLHAFSEG